MSQLVHIHTQLIGTEETNAVNVRELHAALDIGKDYSNWVKQQIGSLGLEENIDYVVFAQKGENPTGGRPSKEYILTLDAAKHIALASRTHKGREIRQYFITAEKRLRTQQPTELSQLSGLIQDLITTLRPATTPATEPTLTADPKSRICSSSWERWSDAEDALLVRLKDEGLTFHQMLPHFPARTHKAITSRWGHIRAHADAHRPLPALPTKQARQMLTYMLNGMAFKCLQYIKDRGGIDGVWVQISYSEFQRAGISSGGRSGVTASIAHLVEHGFILKRRQYSNINQYTVITKDTI